MAPRLRPAAALALALVLTGCQYTGDLPAPSATTAPAAEAALDYQADLFLKNGAVSAVVQVRWPGGEWSKAYGVRSLSANDPAQPSDRVAVSNITETFTAVTVFKLVEDHLIGLDDPVNDIIPNFAAILHPPAPITVRQLLGQTSGIPDYTPASLPDADFRPALAQQLTLEQALAYAGTQPWRASRVGTFQNSGTNYIALGLLVQALRHKPFPEVLREEVIDPLGLKHTSMDRLDLNQPDILHGYVTLHGRRIDTTDNIHFAGTADGGLVSTMPELNDFLAAVFGGRLLSQPSLAEMEKTAESAPYALGVWQGPEGCPGTGTHRFITVGMHEDAITFAAASDDGKYTASMAVVPPSLPATVEDQSGDSQRVLIENQLESNIHQTLDALCPTS